ncbi:MAG: hypothetical protein HRU30_13840 [Rhodobacteraceae bacterium]|nr:hypothetical protein [Paracoccaceae bacterium]
MKDIDAIPLRAPEKVMRLKRLGSFHQCRLSFMRNLLRRVSGEGWTFTRAAFEIDDTGVGHAVYTAAGPDHSYSLVAFAHDLPDDQRSDRVIAEAWDATFTLFDGVPNAEDIARLSGNVPVQEAGRVSEDELTLSRANRSVRLWTHVIDALAQGKQPDIDQIDAVGYLMRTTAVYGSGKFGAADRAKIKDRPEMSAPFQAEMLTVYLIRTFVRDLAEHMARAKGGDAAVRLDPAIARRLGIGNSTGLGMAPFIVNHPILFNNWIAAREEAISRVRALETASADEITHFRDLFARSEVMVSRRTSQHPIQIARIADLTADLHAARMWIDTEANWGIRPWNALMQWAEDTLSEEGQELIGSLLLEPYGDLVDDLVTQMSDDNTEAFRISGAMPVGEVIELIKNAFDWATDLDWSSHENSARLWYVSEEKLEPRLGERFEEPIMDYEQPLAPARDAAFALEALADWDATKPIAAFLLKHPEHRHTIRRAQMSRVAPYGEIHDNTIAADVMPIDMLRAKLSFFGAIHFDPRSDRWVRICMYQGAPYPDELGAACPDDWVYPTMVS